MRTTLYNVRGHYPHFTPYVAKYVKNGGAKLRELRAYSGHYFIRDAVAYTLKHFVNETKMACAKPCRKVRNIPYCQTHSL